MKNTDVRIEIKSETVTRAFLRVERVLTRRRGQRNPTFITFISNIFVSAQLQFKLTTF
jgi:hypothetical protein